jgi:hypothetical protein
MQIKQDLYIFHFAMLMKHPRSKALCPRACDFFLLSCILFYQFLTKMAEEEHEDFSNTAQSGASLTYPMQVLHVNSVFCFEEKWLCLHQR